MCIVFEGVAMGLYAQALATFTIHGMAKRSVTMPKPDDQKVAVNGIATVPPAASASNTRWPSAALSTPMEIHILVAFGSRRHRLVHPRHQPQAWCLRP